MRWRRHAAGVDARGSGGTEVERAPSQGVAVAHDVHLPGPSRYTAAVDPISAIFERLDRWRHLPAYQLERRADIFFAAYLPEVLAEFVGCAIDPRVIPELPLKNPGTNQSAKVDYALLSADQSRMYFIELKTDMASRCPRQDARLGEAARIGSRAVMDDLCEIVRVTKERRKYAHLVHHLASLGLMELPPGLSGAVFASGPRAGRRANELLAQLAPTALDLPIELIFVQPTADSSRPSIDFERFAQHAERRSDPFSLRFAESLRRWTSVAGDVAP